MAEPMQAPAPNGTKDREKAVTVQQDKGRVVPSERAPAVTNPTAPSGDAGLTPAAVPELTTPSPEAPPTTGATVDPKTLSAAPESAQMRRLMEPETVRTVSLRSGEEVRTDRTWVHRRQAGMVSRGFGFLIDVVIVVVLATIVYQLTYATFGMIGIDLGSCQRYVLIRDLSSMIANICRTLRGALYVTVALIPAFYFVIGWLLNGQTIGMYIAGVRVVRTNGKSLGWATAVLRLSGLGMSLFALGLGLLWAAIDRDRQGWHDKIARTYVIYWRRDIAYRESHGYHGMKASGHDAPDGSKPRSTKY